MAEKGSNGDDGGDSEGDRRERVNGDDGVGRYGQLRDLRACDGEFDGEGDCTVLEVVVWCG